MSDNDDFPGIDPELVPYLIAAAEDDEAEDSAEPEAEESERLTALRNLVETSLLAGPDPDLIAELMGEIRAEDDDLFAEEESDGTALNPADAAAERAQVRALASELFARAPEHDFAPTLDRIEQLMDLLGAPQNAYPSIHVAGTNGKTSTSRMIDALLGAFDLRVGRFTSPHLRDVRERITVEGEPLSPAQFLAAWEDIAPYVAMVDEASTKAGGPRLSFFEVLTAMAFAAWADYPVDAAVVECGMGGTWDATNVIDSGIGVITAISLDHQQWLGDTIEQIAAEKAGIIKDKMTIVCQRQEPEALRIIEQRCRETDSVLRLEGRDWEVVACQSEGNGQILSLRTPTAVYADLYLPLHGEHQARNAGAALVAVEALMGTEPLRSDLVDTGLQAVRSPGRLEVLRGSPTVVVDSAHNPGGAQALRGALEEVFDFGFAVGVYSAMRDKQVELVLAELEPVLDELVITQLGGPRAMPIEELEQIASDVFGPDRVHVRDELAEAIDRAAELVDLAKNPSEDKGIVIFGSVVLAGDATNLLAPDRRLG